jgi:hypothetical protein
MMVAAAKKIHRVVRRGIFPPAECHFDRHRLRLLAGIPHGTADFRENAVQSGQYW